MKGFIIAWFCFSVVVLVLTVVSLTTNRWMYDKSQPLSVGLFQICSKTSCSPSHERSELSFVRYCHFFRVYWQKLIFKKLQKNDYDLK